MTESALPTVERARRYLATMEPSVAGQRGHDAAFKAAFILLHGWGLDESTAYALLASEFNSRCQPKWSASELGHKVRSAMAMTSHKPRGYLVGSVDVRRAQSLSEWSPKWPEPNASDIARVAATGPTALGLWERSPVRLEEDDEGELCKEIIPALFITEERIDPLLCAGKSNREFVTRPLSVLLAMEQLPSMALIVPSPMLARTGRTKNDRLSEHTLENTGPRRFLVVEFDEGTTDDHAAQLWHLAGFAPLVLVVHSGGKSLHGWFYCEGEPETLLRKFMAYAVSLGADKATWTRSQFVRLPAGRRENGCRQNVFYFDPAAINRTEVA